MMLSQWMPTWQGGTTTIPEDATLPDGSTPKGAANGVGNSAATTAAEVVVIEEEEELIDDDKLADQLLSQFPAYGSHQQHHQQDWLLMGYPVTSSTTTTTATTTTSSMMDQQQAADDDGDATLLTDQSILSSAAAIRSSPSMSTLGGASSIGGGGGGGADGSIMGDTTTTSLAGSAAAGASNTSGGGRSSSDKQQQNQKNFVGSSTEDWDYEERFLWKTSPNSLAEEKKEQLSEENSNNITMSMSMSAYTPLRVRRHEWIYGRKMGDMTSSSQTTMSTTTDIALTTPNPPRTQHGGSGNTESTPNISSASSSSSRRYFGTLRSPSILSQSSSKHGSTTVANVNNAADTDNDDDDDRQHWMPDQLCKQCYSCETTFTVFRRRHHCRLCGQVFCNMCSAYFLPSQKAATTTLTTTTVAAAAVGGTITSSSGTNTGNTNNAASAATSSSSGGGGGSASTKTAAAAATTTTTTTTQHIRVCRTCHEQVTQRGGLVMVESGNVRVAAAGVDKNIGSTGAHQDSNHSIETKSYGNTAAVVSSSTPSQAALVQSQQPSSAACINTVGKNCSPILGDFDSPEATRIASLQGELGMDSVLQNLSKQQRRLLLPDLSSSTQQEQQLELQELEDQHRLLSPSASTAANSSLLMASTTAAAAAAAAASNNSLASSSSIISKNNRTVASISQQQRTTSTGSTNTDNTSGGTSSSTTDTTTSNKIMETTGSEAARTVREGNRHLGMTAASHLEHMASELLRQHAPLLWNSLSKKKKNGNKLDSTGEENVDGNKTSSGDGINDKTSSNDEDTRSTESNTGNEEADESDSFVDAEGDAMKAHWINQLLTLATRCCATVDPNVKNGGDLLDIRPYCKVKVIPGGSYRDCAYMSGVLFRKTVSHKRMAKEIENPRIMLLSGGIEFTRNENRIASLETLFEQEEKYTEILVGKILKLKPDVLMAGRSVSRRAQELLLKAGVVLIQHVKSKLLSRISRQTGATIISGSDHVMSQFNASILGKCRRFRLATFRDNEVWVDQIIESTSSTTTTDGASSSKADVTTPKTTGKRSIPSLLANPDLKNHERQAALAASKLGQGVLDGAEAVRSGLAKRGVAQTFVMLEGCPKHLGCTVVLRGADRAALKQVKTVLRFLIMSAYNLRLETSYFKERGARIRPDFQVETKHTFSTSLCVEFGTPPAGRKIRPWNGNETAPESETGDITAFDHQSILVTSVWMTDKSQCCPAEVKGICYYSMQDVALGQFLRDSCFNLSLKCQNPNCKKTVLDHSLSFVHNDGLINIVVEEMDEELPPSPNDPLSDDDDRTRKSDAEDEDGEVDKPIATWTYCRNCDKLVAPLVYISENTWKFSFGKFLETFFYNRDAILNAPGQGCSCQLQSSAVVYFGCGKIAARFVYEPVRPFDVFVRRSLPIDISFHRSEARKRLEQISMASSTLFVKFDKHIERVTREARSLFNSAVNRPEHLQTVLSELNRIGSEVDHAAKTLQEKIASLSDECRRRDDEAVVEALLRFPWFARRYLFMLTSAWNEKLSATGQAITAMKKLASSASVRRDGGLAPNVATVVGDPYSDELVEGMKRLLVLNERYSTYNVTDINQALPALPGSEHLAQEEFDDDFDEAETSIDFSDGVDADVLASRRRLQHTKPNPPPDRKSRPNLSKSLGTMRTGTDDRRSNQEASSVAVAPKPTPGGAVKSAFNRLFNRGGQEQDAYVVDLGIFAEGRPRLAPGVKGIVLPVVDEQWSSVIAYSLASTEYAKQFKHFSKFHASANPLGSSPASMSSPDGGNIFDPTSGQDWNEGRTTERRMLVRNKTHIKHTFRDFDEKGHVTCKFVCTTYWATQFHAVRQIFLANNSNGKGEDADPLSSPGGVEQSYIESLSCAYSWAASGGKSGASFSRTSDDRFVIKCISRTELQMFLDCAPAYFEYLSKAFFHGLPTVLCKIVGVYQIGVHNRETGKRSMEQVAVMQNIFYNRKITKIFDLKGSLRGRFAANIQSGKDDSQPDTPSMSDNSGGRRKGNADQWDEGNNRHHDSATSDNMSDESGVDQGSAENKGSTLLDGDFLEFTQGRPVPMTDRAKAVFQMSILNDTLFLSIINVLDYSILVGVDEENMELVVGIIDFMRQYDILKQMERVGKSLPMVVGSEAPTIIQPPLYKSRFTNAMERYFMTVPSKWTQI